MAGRHGLATSFCAALGLAILTLACGGCDLPGSKAGSSTSGTAALSKPGDPKQAFVDADHRTANFKDVKFDRSSVFQNGTNPVFIAADKIAATTNPVVVDSNTVGSDGKTFETVLNATSQVFCTFPQGGPNQRFPGQHAGANAADPFGNLLGVETNWKYLADVDLGGHRDWHLMTGLSTAVTGPNPNNIQVSVDTAEVWIDSRTGKIEQRFNHTVGTEKGVPYEQKITDTNYMYDTGVTIRACV